MIVCIKFILAPATVISSDFFLKSVHLPALLRDIEFL